MAATALLRRLALASALGCIVRSFARCEAHESPVFLSRDLFDFFTAKSSTTSAQSAAVESQEEETPDAEDVPASWTPYFPAASVSASWMPPELSLASPSQSHYLEVFFEELLMKEFPDDDERRAARAIVEESAAGGEDLKHNPEDLSAVLAAVANWKEQLRTSINTLVNDDIGKSLGVSLPQLQQQKVESVLRYNMAKKLRLLELMKAFWSLLRIFKGGPKGSPAPPPPSPYPPSPPPSSTTTTTTTTTTTVSTKKPHKPHVTTTSTNRPGGDGDHSTPGNSETILFLQVAPLTLLNRICQGQREACGQVFGDSLFEAMSAESGDSSFTRERIRIGTASPRGGGVQQPIIITYDGDLYWAGILRKVTEDLGRCASDGSPSICKTMTGQNLTQYRVPVTISSQRVVG